MAMTARGIRLSSSHSSRDSVAEASSSSSRAAVAPTTASATPPTSRAGSQHFCQNSGRNTRRKSSRLDILAGNGATVVEPHTAVNRSLRPQERKASSAAQRQRKGLRSEGLLHALDAEVETPRRRRRRISRNAPQDNELADAEASSSSSGSEHGLQQASFDVLESPSASPPPPRSSFFSTTTYSTLVTLSIVLFAWSMIQPVSASLVCETDADCSSKGTGTCKQHADGASTCVYTSCEAGYWGAGSSYSDCYECPTGMTSLAGKAFYNSDCFIACGDNRCYKPEDGYAECTIEPSTVTHMCISTCNQAGWHVLNAGKPYATCVKEVAHAVIGVNGTLVNQASGLKKQKERKSVRLENRRSGGRRLKKDVDLHTQGPAVAFLSKSSNDPLALLHKK